MNQGSRHDRPATIRSSPREYIPPSILNELRHLDLSGRVALEEMEVIGVGSYGDVLKSRCIRGNQGELAVAVKRLRFYLKDDIEAIFQKEVYVWSKLNHGNILTLLGFAFDETTGFPLLVSEWMSNGSSLNYVKSHGDCNLMRLVSGIAEGLEYLHDNGIVHSDIKPDNIVVTDTGDARICDFGGSRLAAASKSMAKPSTGIRGTPRYLAYELVAFPDQYPRHSKESDVWAFGMTVYALIAQEHPFALHGESHVLKAIADREVPSFNFWTPRSTEEKAIFRDVCRLCWDHDPKYRAAMPSIASNLRDYEQPRDALRPLVDDQPRAEPSTRSTSINSDITLISNSIKDVQLDDDDGLYRPLVKISSQLEVLCRFTSSQSEAYQYLHGAMRVFLSLYGVFSKDFKIDGRLNHLMRAMVDVFTLITARSPAMSQRDEERILIRLLQQAIECCLFINKYSQKNLEERKFGLGDGRKMSEFISFFVNFKETSELGSGALPTFTSSRVTYAIDESVLRQRLNPSETDIKSQRQCLLGTRVEIQEQIIEWALSISSPNILWLHGVTGSGKSTVITSVAEHFRGIYRLGAFLSFTRGASEPSSVISTIAFKLALFDSTIGSLILAETNRDKDIVNASFSTQFEKLLLDPLAIAASAQQGPVIIILDALDQCGISATRRNLMQVLLRGTLRLPLNFKFLITSRREQDIDRAFNSYLSDSVTIIELDYTSHQSRRDVQSYLIHEIRNIIEDEDIPEDGSLERQLSIIGDTAAGLFIFASTVVKLISEHDNPLEKTAEMASNVRSLNGLNQLYSTVLTNSGISWRDSTSKTRFQRVIGLILLSKIPLNESTIDAILGTSVGKCRATLSRLRSVIDYRSGEHIRLFHTSFSDYLLSSGHAEDWFIDITVQNSFLATRCFEIMKEELQFNICDLKSSFIRNDAVDDIEDRIQSRIPAHVSYACNYWSQHLCGTPYESTLIEGLSTFLYSRLLYWLEVMSLLKKVGTIGPALLATAKWTGNDEIEITAFIKDARRLLNIFALPISQSVPHIYLSMLPLTATESKVSAHYLQYTSSLVRIIRRGVKCQSPLLKHLEGHTDSVNSVSFSPDGSLIVSGSYDETVRIWDTERGEPSVKPLKADIGWVKSVTFTPDGTRIVVGGERGIAVLDIESRSTTVSPFGGRALSVVVSPDGKHLVSVSSNVVNMWDLWSGTIVCEPFIGNTEQIVCVAYSRDGRYIVSGSKDGGVRIFAVENGKLVRKPFLGHNRWVNSVVFSPDGKYVVSCSDDGTIRIWDVVKGEVDYSPLTGHGEEVTSVAYSHDGTRIASGSGDVRIWSSRNGQLIAGPFIGHAGWITSIAFSPDGTRVVSGSDDRTLRIWDAESGEVDACPKLFNEPYAVRFSSDGSCVISDDGTTFGIEDGEVVTEGSNNSTERQTLAITNGMQFNFEGVFEWDPITGYAALWNGNSYSFYRIAVSPNRKRFVFGSENGWIRIWDKERDMIVCGPFDGQGGDIHSLMFSPDGKDIVSGSSDIRVWDAETGKLLFGPFSEFTKAPVFTVTYSPDGRYIASGSDDKAIRVWDIKTGHSEVFQGHTTGVRSVSFSPDGSRIVSSSRDCGIRVWSIGDSEDLAQTNQNQLLASSNTNLSIWSLDREGWIRGVHNELLLWVPPDLRPTLWRPQNIAIFNVEFSTALDFLGSAHGGHWQKCFHPPE